MCVFSRRKGTSDRLISLPDLGFHTRICIIFYQSLYVFLVGSGVIALLLLLASAFLLGFHDDSRPEVLLTPSTLLIGGRDSGKEGTVSI